MPTFDPRAASAPATEAFLLVHGTVVTAERARPVVIGDVLVDGGAIVAVGADLDQREDLEQQVRRAARIDATGCIVAPGFVDTHRHAWQTQFRRSIADVDDLAGYVNTTLVGLAPHYTPHDMYTGGRLAAMTAIDAGITTMLDFSHNSRSAAHSDQAIEAQIDSGLRVVHASMSPHFGGWDRQWPRDLARLVETYAPVGGDLLSFRVAALPTDEISGPPLVFGPELAAVALDLGVGVSVDAVFGESSSNALLDWAGRGLLGPHVQLIHCTGLTDEAWRAVGTTGATVTLAPTSDAQIGTETAVPAIDEARAVSVRPGLSIDVEVALASDMFTQMRALLTIQRMRAVESAYGTGDVPDRITTTDVLGYATTDGAAAIGLGEVTGRIAPGYAADLLIVGAEDVNTMPLNDPVAILVLGADARNIHAVVVGGRFRKWAGQVIGLDLTLLHDDVVASRDAIRARSAADQLRNPRRGESP